MSETIQEKNKALVLNAFDTLFNKRDYAAAEKYWSPNYIQHSAHIEPGRDGLFSLIRSVPRTLRYEQQLIVTEGDYVIVHGRFAGFGRPVAWIAADIVRIENGSLADSFMAAISHRRDSEGWRLKVPDYALDKHTVRGKRLGRSWDHWASEGCQLHNEVKGMDTYATEALSLRKRHGKLKQNAAATQPVRKCAVSAKGGSSSRRKSRLSLSRLSRSS